MDSVSQQAIDSVKVKSRGVATACSYAVSINFHPDRKTKDWAPLLLAMAESGHLKSQFETETSNGGMTAYTEGDRWLWEQRAFDGVYDSSPASIRPLYGVLKISNSQAGAATRFGSACFHLKPQILQRATFCYPDSYLQPDHFATAEPLEPLIDAASKKKTRPPRLLY